jgi:hypothetical protein
MTRQEMWKHINDTTVGDLMFRLYERWQNEREHEDINEYLKAIQKSVRGAYKMSKRPFGVFVHCTDGDLQVSVKSIGKGIQLFASSVQTATSLSAEDSAKFKKIIAENGLDTLRLYYFAKKTPNKSTSVSVIKAMTLVPISQSMTFIGALIDIKTGKQGATSFNLSTGTLQVYAK